MGKSFFMVRWNKYHKLAVKTEPRLFVTLNWEAPRCLRVAPLPNTELQSLAKSKFQAVDHPEARQAVANSMVLPATSSSQLSGNCHSCAGLSNLTDTTRKIGTNGNSPLTKPFRS